MESTTLWSDRMNNSNINTNWKIHGDITTTNSPINPSEMICRIKHSTHANNPYMFRITNLSDLIIPMNGKLTINYDILPYNLLSTMICRVLYTYTTNNEINSSIQWQLLSKYNKTQNGINLLSESYEIPITDTNNDIVITFVLYTPNENNNANLLQSHGNNACYLSNIVLKLETHEVETITAVQINNRPTNKGLLTDNRTLDMLLIISFSVLILICFSIFFILLFGYICIYTIKKQTFNESELEISNRIRNQSNTKTCNHTNNTTNTSLGIGRIDPQTEQFSAIYNSPTSNKPNCIEPSCPSNGASNGHGHGLSGPSLDNIEIIEQGKIMEITPNIGPLNQNNLETIGYAETYIQKHRPSSLDVQMDDEI